MPVPKSRSAVLAGTIEQGHMATTVFDKAGLSQIACRCCDAFAANAQWSTEPPMHGNMSCIILTQKGEETKIPV